MLPRDRNRDRISSTRMHMQEAKVHYDLPCTDGRATSRTLCSYNLGMTTTKNIAIFLFCFFYGELSSLLACLRD